jgi:hypothetical protein
VVVYLCVWCGVVWCVVCVVWCGVVWCVVVSCGTLLCVWKTKANSWANLSISGSYITVVLASDSKYSATGTRTRVARVRAEYPNQLDYSGSDIIKSPNRGIVMQTFWSNRRYITASIPHTPAFSSMKMKPIS